MRYVHLAPAAIAALSALASVAYACDGDWRRCAYWALCSLIPVVVSA